jgi:hypothetical protein
MVSFKAIQALGIQFNTYIATSASHTKISAGLGGGDEPGNQGADQSENWRQRGCPLVLARPGKGKSCLYKVSELAAAICQMVQMGPCVCMR